MDFLDSNDFTGGMNSDAENRTLPKGEYRTAINIRSGLSDVASEGCITNVNGNVIGPLPQCPYNNYLGLPNGINLTIGTFEDTLSNSVIHMNWNSNGNCGIYRYYPAQGVTYQIMQYNWGWTQDERITSISLVPGKSGQLLYWVDSNGLKNINLDRANVVGKQKSWKIYMVNATLTIANFGVTLQGFTGNTIVQTTTNVGNYPNPLPNGQPRTLPNYLAYVAQQINAHYGQYLTVTTCDCYLEVTEVQTNGWNLTINSGIGIVVADNWYGTILGDIQFARAVAPSLWEPVMQYRADTNYALNNVKAHAFQSALQFFFSDFQQSVLGVASQIPINNLQCDGTNNPTLNYIDIDFNNSDFIANLSLWLTVITKISVVVRDGNTGTWNTIEILEPCDFLDWANGVFFCHYKFYNDIQGTPLDATSYTNLNSGIAITADSEAFIFNRLIDGGITSDRDSPECVQADYTIQINPTSDKTLYKVSGNIRILTYGLSFTQAVPSPLQSSQFKDWYPGGAAQKFPFWEPPKTIHGGIFHDTSRTTFNFPYFGGGVINSAGDFQITTGMETTFNQLLPEGGFPVYAAGTPFLTISEQVAVNVPTDGRGALDVSAANLASVATFFTGTTPDIYSSFELMLPNGVYVIRLGSHWCSFNDKLGYGFMYNLSTGQDYQQTSTNVHGFWDATGAWQQAKEITITVNNGDIFIGTFAIMDVAPPPQASGTAGEWTPINAYIYDSSGDPLGTTIYNPNAAQWNGISVEKAIVLYGELNNGCNDVCTTDHNGYWFGIVPLAQSVGATAFDGFGMNVLQVGVGRNAMPIQGTPDPQLGMNYTELLGAYPVGTLPNPNLPNPPLYSGQQQTVWVGTLTNLQLKTLVSTTYNGVQAKTLIYGIVPTQNPQSRLKCSTHIQGRVVDQTGNGISAATVVYQNGRTAITDINGDYELLIWGDMIEPNLALFNGFLVNTTSNNDRTIDSLVVSANALCIVTYPNGQIIFNPIVQFFGGNPFDPTHAVIILPFTINESPYAITVAQKRGGKKLYGIRYLDTAGRVCSVVEGFAAYIPFETEDLSKYPTVINPVTNLPYTVPTVLGGQPTLSWSFDPNFAPPIYAAYYQWMWTLDGIYKTELQWVANSVQYVSAFANAAAGAPAINTSFSNGNYVGALISISNLLQYSQVNPDSLIGYSYTAGDRLRLISDRNNVLLNDPTVYPVYTQGIYDFEITGTDSNSNLIVKLPLLPFEIQSGFTIEIYTPENTTGKDIQVFYEVGQVYKCTNPGQTNNAHSVTSGTFNSGDTYWRGRIIQVADSLTSFVGTYPIIVEAPQISDFYVSTSSSINPSRTGTINPYLKQIYYPDRLIVSDQFQEGTAYNGLSFCLATNVTDLGGQFGNVARLIVIGKVLHAIMKNNNVSNGMGVVSLQYAQATSTVEAISSDFLGTQYPSRQNMGTDFPASVVPYDGYIFSLFSLRNAVWRHADDGAIEISLNEYQTYVPGTPTSDAKTRMANYFRTLLQNGKVWDAVAIFDRQYREYILTVWQNGYATAQIADIPGMGIVISFYGTNPDFTSANVGNVIEVTYIDSISGITETSDFIIQSASSSPAQAVITPVGTVHIKFNTNVTIRFRGVGTTQAWNETQKRWTTLYSYVPECYGALGNIVYAFQNGQLWIQDANATQNNWFGVQYQSSLTFVLNDKPEEVKVWNAMSLMQLQADNGNNWSAPVIQNDRGQVSRLLQNAWRKLEEFFYSPFKRDTSDISVSNPILNGRVLRSSSLVITLQNNGTGKFRLFRVGYNIAKSERTSK